MFVLIKPCAKLHRGLSGFTANVPQNPSLSSQHERKGIGRTYVATQDGDWRVLGYYTISSSAVAVDTVPENLPRHLVPVALVGRLAVDNHARGQRLGETLLIHALQSAQRAAKIVGIYAVVVDAFDESAKNFYLKYGFKELADDLFISICL